MSVPVSAQAGGYVLPGEVGFLGNEGDLTPMTDTAVISLGPGTYDGYYFQRGTYLTGAGTYIFRNSIIEGTAASWLILAYDANLGGSSTITVEDTTLRWKAGDTLNGEGQGAIVNLGVSLTLNVTRCDVSGKADGLQTAGTVTVTDTYIHDLVWAGTPPNNTHNDGTQHFAGSLSISGCYYLVGAQDPYSNSCVFTQGGEITTVSCVNSYLSGGAYSYYAQNGAHTVTGCTFNTDNTPANARLRGHLFGTHVFEGGGWTLTEWSNNKDHLGNPISF